MDFDVISKLFPNVLTMITQLLATGVLFVLYKNYLHEPVLNYLAKRNALIADELESAKNLNTEARIKKELGDQEYAEFHLEIKNLKEKMINEAKMERDQIIASASVEIERLKEANRRALESEKAALYDEVSEYIFDVASLVNKRVLEDVSFNEEDMLKALQKEIDRDEYQH